MIDTALRNAAHRPGRRRIADVIHDRIRVVPVSSEKGCILLVNTFRIHNKQSVVPDIELRQICILIQYDLRLFFQNTGIDPHDLHGHVIHNIKVLPVSLDDIAFLHTLLTDIGVGIGETFLSPGRSRIRIR